MHGEICIMEIHDWDCDDHVVCEVGVVDAPSAPVRSIGVFAFDEGDLLASMRAAGQHNPLRAYLRAMIRKW